MAFEVDPDTKRLRNDLPDNDAVPVNAVFFSDFKHQDNEYLTRTWLIGPQEAAIKAAKLSASKQLETWNKRDFYVSLGESNDANPNYAPRAERPRGGQGRNDQPGRGNGKKKASDKSGK